MNYRVFKDREEAAEELAEKIELFNKHWYKRRYRRT